MAVTVISPSRYVQGRGAMNDVGMYAAKLGSKALCLISAGGIGRVGERIKRALPKARLPSSLRNSTANARGRRSIAL